jgi:cytosine/uracil/thiamine/allantoin permease
VVALFARSGSYWYRRGFNPVALGWFVAGIVLAAMFSSSAIYEGPLVGLIGGGDISIFVGFAVSLIGYYLTMRSRVQPAPDAAAAPETAEEPAVRTAVRTDEATPA